MHIIRGKTIHHRTIHHSITVPVYLSDYIFIISLWWHIIHENAPTHHTKQDLKAPLADLFDSAYQRLLLSYIIH